LVEPPCGGGWISRWIPGQAQDGIGGVEGLRIMREQ
jgi:hypothetical protein